MSALPTWNSVRGSWQLDSTLMCGPAWQPIEIEQLWRGAPKRFKTRRIPGVAGSVAYGALDDERELVVDMWITGVSDQSGTPFADPVEGFNANVDSIFALLGARTSTITRPDAGTRTASVVATDFDYAREKGFSTLARGSLTITIPSGEHTTP